MFDVDQWMEAFQRELSATFGDRLWFLGLQGSRARGEARQDSDIDVVVVLDELSPADVKVYRTMLDGLDRRELVCGFLSGKRELLGWDSADLFQFYHDTRAIVGSLDDLKPLITDEAVRRAIKVGACNIYHACVHNMVHERSEQLLAELCKAAAFVIRADFFLQTHRFVGPLDELSQCTLGPQKRIVETLVELRAGRAQDFDAISALLMEWTAGWVRVPMEGEGT